MGNLLSTPKNTASQQISTTTSPLITIPAGTTTTPTEAIPTRTIPIITTPTITTIPSTTIPLMSEQNAQTISMLQKTIISEAQTIANNANIVYLGNSTIPQSTLSNATQVEAFSIQRQPPDLYQTPLYVPASGSVSGSAELDDYVSAYNKSIALLDDPNRMSQANFDAYIHLQDNKIAQLQSAISSFPTNAQQQNNPIRAIKNLKTSVGLNVEPYPDPATQTNLPSYYNGNGSSKYPNYLIYTNNGCLQYTHGDSSTKTAASYSVQPCNANLAGQRFNMQQVNNMAQYNNIITDPNNASYKITDPNSSIFGFYVVNPEGYGEQCLQLNGDGLSVMPCNMDSSQRFKPYYHSITP